VRKEQITQISSMGRLPKWEEGGELFLR